jgi:signal transduction histidine kinase/ligand-binding sensor domain-containing protein
VGRLYFVTYGGLSVYDGTRFSNYTRHEGLANDLVNDVLELGRDTLLVATNAPMINTLIHGRVGIYNLVGNHLPVVNRFLRSKEGDIYCAADDGLYVMHGNAIKRLPLYDRDGMDLGQYLDGIIEWRNYLLVIPWDARIEKLILFDKQAGHVVDVYSATAVLSIRIDNNEHIWITTSKSVNILNMDSLAAGKIRPELPPGGVFGPGGQKPYTIFFDHAGNTWAYADNSLLKISPQGIADSITYERGFKFGALVDVFEDREGIVWMSTDGSGVIKMKGTNIQVYDHFPPYGVLSAGAIQAQHDTLWIFNDADKSVLRLEHEHVTRFSSPFPERFGSLYLHQQKIFLANDEHLVSISDKNRPLAYRQPLHPVSGEGGAFKLGTVAVDAYGSIIQFVSYGDSLFAIDVFRDNRLLTQYRISSMTDKMLLDHQLRLWVPTRDDHLLLFTLHPEQPGHYLQLIKDFKPELPPLGIRAITQDQSGNLWIGTRNNGVYRLEIAGTRLNGTRQFTTHDGLTDNFVYTIAADNNDNIFVGTQSGLDMIFRKNGTYVVSNISKSNNYFQAIRQVAVTPDNTVWALTGEQSLLKFKPGQAARQALPPPVLLTLQEINGKAFTGSVNSFSYRDNNFSFSVAAPSFFDEKSILYSYQLEGSGYSGWSTPSANTYLAFSNLSPGQYTLRVRAQFPDAQYTPQTAAFTFSILPPWWQTWWFRGIAVSLLVGLLVVITRFYYRKKLEQQKAYLERQQAIEKERTRIATDMHDDLGAGLSRIKFLSETIGIKQQRHQPVEEEISKIREYSHEMIDKMGEIVWALNEKNDTLSDLLSYTRAYAVEYLAQNGIQCQVKTPDNIPADFVTGEFRRNIFLTVKEALHNIVKHSQANSACITVTDSKGLELRISDNGIGFDPGQTRPFSNGIANMKKRIAEIGGTFEIFTNNGTTIQIQVPLDA